VPPKFTEEINKNHLGDAMSKLEDRDTDGLRTKISLSDLNTLLDDPETSKSALKQYVVIDKEESQPFQIVYEPNPNTVEIPQFLAPDPKWIEVREALSKFINSIRNSIFDKTISDGYDGPIIVSEGDSWFISMETDAIDDLILKDELAIYCLKSIGDTLESMVQKAEYIEAIREKNATILLLSGGGNEIVAGGKIKEYLGEFDKNLSPRQHLLPNYKALSKHESVRVICHGYD
jgi:hypothetical protein